MFDHSMQELVFNKPSLRDVAWENITEKDWIIISEYRGGNSNNSLYELSLEEQFMFLCFVVQAEDRPVYF